MIEREKRRKSERRERGEEELKKQQEHESELKRYIQTDKHTDA